MLGVISIEHLEIPCIIGVNPREREEEQSIFVDLKIKFDMRPCIDSDKIHDTIDYLQLAHLCTEIAREGRFKLLEAYAHAVLKAAMDKYELAWAWIRVKKPLAISKANFTSIELEKSRCLK